MRVPERLDLCQSEVSGHSRCLATENSCLICRRAFGRVSREPNGASSTLLSPAASRWETDRRGAGGSQRTGLAELLARTMLTRFNASPSSWWSGQGLGRIVDQCAIEFGCLYVPMPLGQELGAYAVMIGDGIRHLEQ